jgi:hypothetical protein
MQLRFVAGANQNRLIVALGFIRGLVVKPPEERIAGFSGAAEVAGVKVEDKAKVPPAGPELILNGAGLRTRMLGRIKVYVAGLYLTEKKTSAADVLALKGPKRVQLTLMRDVAANQMFTALNEGLTANLSTAELEKFKGQIEQLSAIMALIKEVKEGDVMTLDLVPDAGTHISLNGQPRGKPIPGDDFYPALLKIWLGDNPVQPDLKKAFLGQG